MLKFKLPIKKDIGFCITSKFGWRSKPKRGFHTGTDIINNNRTIHPCYFGKVIFVGWRGNYGKTVIIHHHTCGNVWSLYAHLAEIKVEAGAIVDQNSYLGIMGSTGYSTGIHLHFEVRLPINGIAFCHNPLNYIT